MAVWKLLHYEVARGVSGVDHTLPYGLKWCSTYGNEHTVFFFNCCWCMYGVCEKHQCTDMTAAIVQEDRYLHSALRPI